MSAAEVVYPQQFPPRQLHKFGGSSLADPECFRRVVRILEQYSGKNDLIVVSAAGKTTNTLIEWLSLVGTDAIAADAVLASLRDYQSHLIKDLLTIAQRDDLLAALEADIKAIRAVMAQTITPDINAWVQGFGEIWSARLLSMLLTQNQLPTVYLDSRTFLRAEFAPLPEVDRVQSWPLLEAQLTQHPHVRVVITGFIAQNQQGETVLLGRNGSDYSATVIGAMANVKSVTIWSDVAGVYSADPRLVNNACLLPLLRLDEAAELARLGAPVLHARTLQPVAQSCIDLNLRCSYDSEAGSTRIERVLASGRGAKIVTSLNEVCLLQLDVPYSHDLEAARCEIERLLVHYQIQPLVSLCREGQHRIQLIYTPEVVNNALAQLQNAGIPAEIRLKEDYSLIAAVGAGVISNSKHCHGFYQQLRGQPIEFIHESVSGLSIIAILRKANTPNLLNRIHRALFRAQRRVGVVLFGKGNIGSCWLDLFAKQKAFLEQRSGMNIELISVQDRTHQWVDLNGLNPLNVNRDFAKKAISYQDDEWMDAIQNHSFDEIVVMDVTACPELAKTYADFAYRGFHLISANKFAGADSRDFYQKVCGAFEKTGRMWLYNATVGAGLPVNYAVRDLRDTGDQILALSGIFSGTLSWLFQHYSDEMAFSERLEQAWQQGLTEPDPREDLSGADVMRKLVILARDSGLSIEPDDVEVQSLVPSSLMDLTLDEFFEQSTLIDASLAMWQKKAQKEQGVLRYVARLNRDGKARVGLEIIDHNSPLAHLLACDNFFAIESEWYRDNPLVIQGPGAGRNVTAGALMSDLNRLMNTIQ